MNLKNEKFLESISFFIEAMESLEMLTKMGDEEPKTSS